MLTPAQRKYTNSRHLQPGTRLGLDLTLGAVLGEGGTGVVYSAQHAVLKREVAVKMCHVTGPDGREARARLIREAQMCASVRDPRVPRIYALDKLEDGTPYVVMEKVAGQPLATLIAEAPPTPRVVCTLIMELLGALISVHRAGVVHRDVKPSNLMVDLSGPTPRLKLLDFGIGKTLSPRPMAPLTRRGAVIGTPLYMAPEQILEGTVDERADVYATGVVLFELLAGRPPFRAASVAEIFACVLRDEIPSIATLRPDLPPALVAVVTRATQKKPDARYSCARDMATGLREAVAAGIPDNLPSAPIPKPLGLQATVPSIASHGIRVANKQSEIRPTWMARTLRAPRKGPPVVATRRTSDAQLGYRTPRRSRAVAML